ncbi:MAG: cytochrome c peroxidase [Phycisphaerales bacterium]|jgi:cytochrome c peroxidase|nr:cytochrome c peroxidase [Phycisphaerales bacterium]MDP6312397.1 cytochrome c peroxidase [Phycisphaerales bacterium]MDP7087570.1 cytochrome c peroxidase [Phycisphaerales bacterium]MDP7188971.1 cytochrome c peroxidase [Phycisphaerales bacterium]MDP7519333.1 cytochrome c peroxidase [Phycisphaerales bacterium]|tara:strand:- start:1619 stop:2887 length:1269 start_codon:yes stop_codon:yes gene_type:complete
MKHALLATAMCTAVPLHATADDRPSQIERSAMSLSPLPAPPPNPTNRVADDPAAAVLGQTLFFDPGLSRNGEISCATCHDPDKAFTDGKSVAEGLEVGTINTPTVLGAAHHRWLFLDGRADTLWSQATSPIENDLEMGNARTDVVRYVAGSDGLASQYTAIFGPLPDLSDQNRFPPTARPGTPQWETMLEEDRHRITKAYVNLGKAIEAYERLLAPGESSFDRWAASIEQGHRDDALISPEALRGFELFAGDAGCTQCHFGLMISDLEFHDLALPPRDQQAAPMPGRGAGYALLRKSEFRADGPWSDAPESTRARRAAAARIGPEHWGSFRTPSLRNVARTAPYMHSGQFRTLGEALAFYNTLEQQVRRHHHAEAVLQPLNFTPEQLADLEAFLRSLNGGKTPKSLSQPLQPNGTASPESSE